jgi:hypothetical protein
LCDDPEGSGSNKQEKEKDGYEPEPMPSFKKVHNAQETLNHSFMCKLWVTMTNRFQLNSHRLHISLETSSKKLVCYYFCRPKLKMNYF